jgi:imidazole glycerol-phosphate synthase subunit HisH
MSSVAIIDYGMGNVRSVMNALSEIGAESELVAEPASVSKFDRVILPGVGAFAQAIAKLRESGMADELTKYVATGKPVLGICLGMQLMCSTSSEDGEHKGLDWVKAKVVRFPEAEGLKVPHMGWNGLRFSSGDPLFANLEDGGDVYFVHSYYVDCEDKQDEIAKTEHGIPFTSMFRRKNVSGMQFHPEKSQQIGLTLLSNFLKS